jgi:hypothetical protein
MSVAAIVERDRRQQHAFNRHGLVDPNVNGKMTFGGLVDWWRDSYAVRLGSQTIVGSIDKHLRPRFGDLKLSEIDASEFEIFLKSMAPEYKPRTPNSLRAITRRIFNLAIKARKSLPAAQHGGPAQGDGAEPRVREPTCARGRAAVHILDTVGGIPERQRPRPAGFPVRSRGLPSRGDRI